MNAQEIRTLSDTIKTTYNLKSNLMDLDVSEFIAKKQKEGFNLMTLNNIVVKHKDTILDFISKENTYNDDRFYTYGIISLSCRMSKLEKYTG